MLACLSVCFSGCHTRAYSGMLTRQLKLSNALYNATILDPYDFPFSQSSMFVATPLSDKLLRLLSG